MRCANRRRANDGLDPATWKSSRLSSMSSIFERLGERFVAV
jgi:hypothetical protein